MLANYATMLKTASDGKGVVPEIAEYFPAEDWERQIALLLEALR